jgi:hypothetical protein
MYFLEVEGQIGGIGRLYGKSDWKIVQLSVD